MRLIKTLETDLVILKPAALGHGLTLHGIPVRSENVMKFDARVDLSHKGSIVFLAEHILGPVKLLGIEDAEIFGKKLPWDFARPVHRYAYSLGMDTGHIFGPPDGRHCFEITHCRDCLEPWNSQRFCTVRELISYELEGYGKISIHPADPGDGMHFTLRSGRHQAKATVYVARRETEESVRDRILTSRTPAVCGFTAEEPLWHGIGDFVSDLCGIGSLTDAVVEADVIADYHAITVGAVKYMEQKGALVYV